MSTPFTDGLVVAELVDLAIVSLEIGKRLGQLEEVGIIQLLDGERGKSLQLTQYIGGAGSGHLGLLSRKHVVALEVVVGVGVLGVLVVHLLLNV